MPSPRTGRRFAQKLELTNNDFVRTTSARHKEFVQAILAKLHAAGQFYNATYQGFYSAKEETFLTDKDRRPDGTFDPAYGEVTELAENNYWFKLQTHQQWLIDYHRSESGLRATGLSPQRSARLPQEQHARRPLHLAPGCATELGHSRCPSTKTTSPMSGSTRW